MPAPDPKTPQVKLMMNTEAAEPGTAALVRNGKVVYEVDGHEVEVDYRELRASNSTANEEARVRRETLDRISKALGLNVDVRTDEGLRAVEARLANYATDTAELEDLRRAREAGELDTSAKEKIEAAARRLAQEQIAKATTELETFKKENNELKGQVKNLSKDLNDTQVTTGLRAYYDASDAGFREGAMEMFLVAAQQEHDGYRWRPAGTSSSSGVPDLHMVDDAGVVRKGPDGVNPLTIDQWSKTTLRDKASVLFKVPNSGPDGSPAGGIDTRKNAAEVTPGDLKAAARRSYGGQQPTA